MDLTGALEYLTPDQLLFLEWQRQWSDSARPNQIVPKTDWTEAGFLAGRGFGKALALDTPIPTLDGWKAMGELQDGDVVFAESGAPCTVVKAHDVLLGRPCYAVRFDDGSTIVADGEHLWATLSRADRRAKRGAQIRTTECILSTLRVAGETNHAVPVAGALDLPHDSGLPIDPYLLGLWLGDGGSAGGYITTADREVVSAFEAVGYTMRPWATEKCGRAKIYGVVTEGAKGKKDAASGRFVQGGFPEQLRALGLINSKHIPARYLRVSAAQRMALLQGLVDSDGHVNPSNGNVEVVSVNPALAAGVHELALSLGFKARVYEDRAQLGGEDKGARFRICWQADAVDRPARLPRKVAALQQRRAPTSRRRYIVAVEPVPSVPVRCITVDSPSSLYLAGRTMIPTHNTRVGAEWMGREVYEDPTGFDSCVIAPTYRDVKFTCFEGESGLLSVIPPDLVVEYNRSDLFIRMRNVTGGVSMIRGFTAEKPESLRGPQNCRGWFDELAAWQRADETWDMAMFGMRLGPNPQVLWTTTPKPRDIIRRLTTPQDGRIIVRGSTYDNKANLPKSFFKQLEQYEGTTIGRQELHGELIDPEESGIVRRSNFRLWPANKPLPPFEFIILSLDTAFTEATIDKRSGDPDSSACVVLGSFRDRDGHKHLMVLDCWSEQLGLPDLIRRVKRELNVSYGDDQDTALIKPLVGSAKPVTSGRKPDLCLIEDKGSGISLRQMLEREGIIAYAYNPGRADKLARLHMVSHIFARKRVWLPESDKHPGKPRTWVEPMLAQLCAYTGPGSTKHDDYVDAVTQCVRLAVDKGLVTVLRPDKPAEVLPPRAPVANPYAA